MASAGWTLFTVIQTGTIAAVAVGFARYAGVIWPAISESRYLIDPVHLSSGYAVSLSVAQAIAIGVIGLLTWLNMRGVHYGRFVQNTFTTAKGGALIGLIAAGLILGWNTEAVTRNFSQPWTPVQAAVLAPGLDATSLAGLLVALAIAQVGSLFASDAWNNITFTAGEVKNPRRDVPLSLAFGTGIVMTLYVLANLAHFVTLPVTDVQNAPAGRVAAATLEAVIPGTGAMLMAAGIMISTFGCANALVLTGARAYYAMARDGLFFASAGRLNRAAVPAWGLVIQGIWAGGLVLPRTYDPATGAYGNLYSSLLDYVVSAALLFYILTIAGVFRLRATRPDVPRPYRAFGYPWLPAAYIVAAAAILGMLAITARRRRGPGS